MLVRLLQALRWEREFPQEPARGPSAARSRPTAASQPSSLESRLARRLLEPVRPTRLPLELALTRSQELRLARSARSRLAVVMAPTLAASRARLVRSRLAVALALILMALLVPLVHSLREARPPERVRLLQLEADSLGLPTRVQQLLRLVVALRRRTMRPGSSNLALRRSRRSNRCHLQALRVSRARLLRARDSMRPGESNFRRFPHS